MDPSTPAAKQVVEQVVYTETYRLSQIPKSFDVKQVKELFKEADRKLIRDPVSLAQSISSLARGEKIATVTFSRKPSFAAATSPRDPQSFKLWEDIEANCLEDARNIRIDSSFEGLTPLNEVDTRVDTVDLVACTGIYGRAFGSWQHPKGTMWLRDVLPQDLPNCRVLLWGKHSQFHRGDNPSHGDITHYRDSLVEDLCRLRKRRMDKRRPLVLLGHSFGGILIKAAFVKLSQDPAFLEVRNTIGGLVFFATPHEGIYNQPWLDIWGQDPAQKLIRDLGPGSTLLRDLRENLGKCLQEEKVLTLYELHETATVQKTTNKPDKYGPPALMIDEKASCINHPNETRLPFHGDHSKIAKLSCGEGCIYHSFMEHLPVIIDSARLIVYHRTMKKYMIDVLSTIKSCFRHLLEHKSSSLLMAELSELDNISFILQKTTEPFLKSEGPGHSGITEATNSLQTLFQQSVLRITSINGSTGDDLLHDFGEIVWAESAVNFQMSAMDSDELARAFIPSIIQLKQSLCAVLGAQDSSILQAFVKSDEAKRLGLDFVVRARELWSSINVVPAVPLLGNLADVTCKQGLNIATWYPKDGTDAEPVICEYRSYAIQSPGNDPSGNALNRDEKIAASRELASILSNLSQKSAKNTSATNILDPTMSIFQFEGYVDDPEHEQLIFMYVVPPSPHLSPRQVIDQSMTLDKWLRPDKRKPRGQEPRLEERLAIAYHLCRSVFNQHICGWVHKSIRPDNIVLIPTPTNGTFNMKGSFTCIPYLKGFEHARPAKGVSDLLSLQDTENDVYRHPNRRGSAAFKQVFHPIHDIYAVGTVLVEIGLAKSIGDTIKTLRDPPSEGNWEDDLVRIAGEKLPRHLGTRYAQCAIKCLKGYRAFGVDRSEKDSTELAFEFRSQVTNELMRMAVACGYML